MMPNDCDSHTLMIGNGDRRKPIIFYTSRITPSCRAVRMLATHLDIQLQEVSLRCYIDTRTEKFRKINPCHTLPVIDDNDFVLWESRAIMQYLCNKYAPNSNLYPTDAQKRATVDRLLNFDLKTLSHAVMAVHYEFTFPGEYSASRGKKMVAVTDALTLLEIFLIEHNYVACDHLTIADLSILASVTLLEIAVEFDLTSYPNIWNWYNRLRNELPYYDPLTKVAHDELRALIRNIRDAHDEWSSPLQQCAFVPNQSHVDCAEDQRRQYKRLFLNDNDHQDAARIMAAVSPVFRNRSFSPNPAAAAAASNNNASAMAITTAHTTTATTRSNHNVFSSNLNEIDVHDSNNYIINSSSSHINNNNICDVDHESTTVNVAKMVRKAFPIDDSTVYREQTLLKRIRLTIEPNTGQSLQLSHFEPSPIIEQTLTFADQSPFQTLYSNFRNDHLPPQIAETERMKAAAVANHETDVNFVTNYDRCNRTFCHQC